MGLLELLALVVLLAILMVLLKPELVVSVAKSVKDLTAPVEEDLLKKVARELGIEVEGRSEDEIARRIIERVKGNER